MTPTPPEHLVFVDFENVPDIDLSGIVDQPVQVMLLLGKNQKKLDVTLVEQLQRLGKRVELVRGGASGHNALDLVISFHLGQAVRQNPQARFHIVSKDTDFDPLIAHVRSKEVVVARHTSFESLPFLVQPKKTVVAAPMPAVDRRAKVIARLTNPASTNRPSTEKALRAHIKTALGKESSNAAVQDVVGELTSKHGLQIESATGKVTYPSGTLEPPGAPPGSCEHRALQSS